MQVIPLTSNIDKCYPCEAYVMIGSKKGKAMIDRIMTVSKLRLKSKINVISNEDIQLLKYALKLQLSL
ncbi:MAG: type II toxin-antitoxin system PemK/MazF family toxin [Rickettsia africae]|uniref:PemK-like growth inhibitor n=1 Tax=Rickettsia africae (strain ESF-5) TaxID=347255 RepID=C3PLL6_RICAE|nr:PemK-like growth inhibitor [Rickettsia africae ESF-5]